MKNALASRRFSPKASVSLGRKALHGLIWMLAQNVVARATSLLSQLVLAALLTSADFGVIGLAYTVTNVASVLMNVGVDDVLLQRHRSLRLWVGPAFWVSFGLATVAAVGIVAISPLAAAIFQAPQIVGLIAAFSVSMPLSALSTVPTIILRSEMKFGIIAAYTSFEVVATAALTVLFAWIGLGAYSFVLPVSILSATRAVVYWWVVTSRGSLRPNFRRWRYLVGNTAANFTSRVVLMVIGQGDYVVLGLLASKSVVGAYYFGFRLAAQPLWTLAGNFSGILYPALTQFKDDPRRQSELALRASTLLSFCVMPIAMIQAAVAGPGITALFGERWADAIPIIQLLSIGLSFEAVSWSAGALLSARGGFVLGMKFLLVQLPIFLVLIVAGGLWDQAVGVAWGVCIYYAITQPVYVAAIFRQVGVSQRQVIMIYLKPLGAATVAVALPWLAVPYAGLADRPLLQAIFIGVIASLLYIISLRVIARDVWQELASRLTNSLIRRSAS